MLRLSNRWAPILGAQPETGMGYQVVSVTLKDGRRFDDVRVVGGVVTKVGDAGDVPFRDDEIQQMVCTHEAHALYAECQATALKPANSSCAKGLATLPGGQTFMGVAEYRAFLCDLDGWIIAGRLTPIGSPTPRSGTRSQPTGGRT